MRRIVELVLFMGMTLLVQANAEPLGGDQWKNLTDMKSVSSIALRNGTIAATTGGGLFFYDVARATFSRVTNSEGLSSNDLKAVLIDESSRVWAGASDGSVNVLDPSIGQWHSTLAIQQSNHLQKGIQRFYSQGDSLFVASQFGVSVFRISRSEFGDTYANFGFSSQPTVTDVLVEKNRVWVGTNQGLATALLTSPNLSSPTSWTINTSQGLPSSSITSIALLRDTLVVGTTSGAAFFTGTIFQSVPSFNGRAVTALFSTTTQLFVLVAGPSDFRVESLIGLAGSSSVIAINDSVSATSLTIDPGTSQLWVGTTSRGIATWNGGSWLYTSPNGPQSNLFVSLAVDDEGVLWCGSGINGGGKGFYRYNPGLPDDRQWKNFTTSQYPAMGSDDYYKPSVGAAGSVWISSWGAGAVEVAGDSIRRKIDVSSKPSFAPTLANGPNFTVVGGAALDPKGATWFTNRTAVNGNFLAELVNDSTFVYHRNLYNVSEGVFQGLVIDANGTKWIANAEPTAKADRGLFFFNETGTVAGTELTNGWGYFSTADGLPNNTVMALSVDLDGEVWIGTDLGAMIISDPLLPKSKHSAVFPLREQSVQTIAVDAVNNKWVGTKEGVFVLSPDGTQLLQQYNQFTTNGELVDNDIRSIVIDQRRGIAYFGTEKGLSSLLIAPVRTQRSYSTLQFGPNPFLLPGDVQLTIQNLVASSTIKILNVNGLLISQFKAQGGGRAFWDGRDTDGRLVASGVYFVVAFTENGNQTVTGKVAVIRK